MSEMWARNYWITGTGTYSNRAFLGNHDTQHQTRIDSTKLHKLVLGIEPVLYHQPIGDEIIRVSIQLTSGICSGFSQTSSYQLGPPLFGRDGRTGEFPVQWIFLIHRFECYWVQFHVAAKGCRLTWFESCADGLGRDALSGDSSFDSFFVVPNPRVRAYLHICKEGRPTARESVSGVCTVCLLH